MTAVALLLIANVPARELGHSIIFAEEVTQFLTFIFTFVGLAYAVRIARHVRMAAVYDLVSPRIQKLTLIVASAVGASIMFHMAIVSLSYTVWIYGLEQTTPALRLPYWIPIAIAPPSFFMAGVYYVRTLHKNIVEKEAWLSFEQRSEYE